MSTVACNRLALNSITQTLASTIRSMRIGFGRGHALSRQFAANQSRAAVDAAKAQVATAFK